MIIEYETSKYVTEKQQIEIEDNKNVFLKGRSDYSNMPTYFGIWSNGKYFISVTLSSGNINYSYSSYESTESDVRHYLYLNRNVEVISKNSFKQELEKATSLLKL